MFLWASPEFRQEDTNFVVPLFSFMLTGNTTCLMQLVAFARAVSWLAESIPADIYKQTAGLAFNFTLFVLNNVGVVYFIRTYIYIAIN